MEKMDDLPETEQKQVVVVVVGSGRAKREEVVWAREVEVESLLEMLFGNQVVCPSDRPTLVALQHDQELGQQHVEDVESMDTHIVVMDRREGDD